MQAPAPGIQLRVTGPPGAMCSVQQKVPRAHQMIHLINLTHEIDTNTRDRGPAAFALRHGLKTFSAPALANNQEAPL